MDAAARTTNRQWARAKGQWEREYFLFSRIMRIRFFAQFRMWKAFFYWKKHIRSTKTAKCQGVLVDNLLILNDHLRDPLLRLRETLVEVSSLDLFHVGPARRP